ncbi:P-loop NTPase [Clostridium tyrobutyricum]|uniref:P-loop NTPase n=1 Tax=Clostridium tyrobutyricum TaxID=1519 RepID=UPI002420012F|nr:P-loop NTPase [Clostridium tyrobutyricum]
MLDQASKLRALVDNGNEKTQNGQGIKIYSVASGKGGVGKTNFSVNLAIKLQQMGKRCICQVKIPLYSNPKFL